MKNLSKSSKYVILAYEKGYRIRNGEIFNPRGKKVNGFIRARTKNGKFKYKYFSIALAETKKKRNIPIHRLVAYQRFGEAALQPGIHVRHLDGNSLNNLKENIDIGSQSDNMMDRDQYERAVHALKTSWENRILSEEQVKELKKDRRSGMSYNQIMEKYNISSKGTVSYIINKALYYRYETLEKAINYLKIKFGIIN